MNHRLTSTRLAKAASALVLLCTAVAYAAGAGPWRDAAQHRSAVAGGGIPEWNNTGSAVRPPVV